MWLACLFGEAFACSVRVGMQKGAKSSELGVREQYQIATFHVKSSGETSRDAQTRFPLGLSIWRSTLGHGGAVGLQEMLADSNG